MGEKRIRENESEREREKRVLWNIVYTFRYAPYCAAMCYLSEHVIRSTANLLSRNIFAVQILS